MEYLPRTYSVLSVAAAEKFHTSLRELLPGGRYAPVQFAYDAADARRRLLESRYDIIIISAPLRDEFGTHLAQHFAEQSGAGILLLVKPEYYSDVSAQVTPCGVLTLPKPTSAQLVTQTMQLLCGTCERLRRMAQKTASLEEKMEDIRIINHAKWLLIDQLKMTEAQAHRYIEKQAMDRCVSRREIAENILSTYK